jgi:threo-3-hydroxy-L-aspartate ammonia-lyase
MINNQQLFSDIQSAYQRLKSVAHQTPVMTSSILNKKFNADIYFKCENFQKVGAFKFRGAYNSLIQLSQQQKSQGVIAYSSGNHAQAVACVGQLLGIKTTIVMPMNAPQIKLKATQAYGAEVIVFDPEKQTREDVAADILEQRKLTLIPPFDHPHVIAGQATATVEFLQQQPNITTLLTPCGGGGLLSGSAIAAKNIRPNCRVIGIEPEQADDATESFRTGVLQFKPNPQTIADGTRTASLGEITFPLIQHYVDDMQTVSEFDIKQAVALLFYHLKIVVEPSGALGLAAILAGKVKTQGPIGIMVSGGNIDAETICQILQDAPLK